MNPHAATNTCRNHEDTKDTKTHEERFLQELSPDPLFQHGNVEIHQQPDTDARHSHVIQRLRVMNRRKMLHGLDLENKRAAHDEVEKYVAEKLAAIFKRNALFSLERNLSRFQFQPERLGVRVLWQAGTEFTMHHDAAADRLRDQVFELVGQRR